MTGIPPIALPLPADLTHHEALVCMWIGSDPGLLEQMRLLADGDEFEYGDFDLSVTVADMLYDPAYGKQVPDLLHVVQNGGDLNHVGDIRDRVPQDALLDIGTEGWARIRTALLAGTEKDPTNACASCGTPFKPGDRVVADPCCGAPDCACYTDRSHFTCLPPALQTIELENS